MWQKAISAVNGGGNAPIAYEQGSCYPSAYVKQVGNCVFNAGHNDGNNIYLRGYVSEGVLTITRDGSSGGYTADYTNGTLTITMVNTSGYYPYPYVDLYYEDV